MTPLLLAAADNQGTAGLGLLIMAILLVVTALLVRNMSKRIKRLPSDFPEQDRPDAPEPTDPPQQR